MKPKPPLSSYLRRAAAALLCSVPFLAAAASSTVTTIEQDIVLPTYLAGDPEPNPMFYFGRNSQGAEGRIYPYPLYDTLTYVKTNKTYRIVWLENEYLRIGILPDKFECPLHCAGILLFILADEDVQDFVDQAHCVDI